jgi:hypothetical protein
MASIRGFIGLIEGLTCEFGVSINMYWVIKCAMMILGQIVKSIVANGGFMLCGST